MKKIRIILAGLLTAVAAGGRIWIEAHRQPIIISNGVSGYRTLLKSMNTMLAAMVVVTILIVILEALSAMSRRKEEEAQAAALAAEEEERRKTKATLSVQGNLDPEEIRTFLLRQADGEWHRYRGNISLCVGIMDQMSECIERLDTLLSMNGAETLRDTEDVLRQVQQYICRNMRKVINYLSAVDVESPDQEAGIRQRFSDCIGDSTKKLDKVNEFIVSLSDFLNSQGEDSSSLDMLDIYKDTILESIHGVSQMPG